MLRVINPTETEMSDPSSFIIEVIPDLDEDDHLLVELYSTIIPPLYYSFMILFICIYKGEEGPNSNQFLQVVQKLAEKVHGMGLLANAGFVSMLSLKSAYTYLLVRILPRGCSHDRKKVLSRRLRPCRARKSSRSLLSTTSKPLKVC